MPKTAISAREGQRLSELSKYHILDTPPQAEFDGVVRLAAQICGTAMAVMTLVDNRRQWFKAKVGLVEDELPRQAPFCALVISGQKLLEVADARKDPAYAQHPLVAGPARVAFYAGVPLVTADGFVLGTLCVMDQMPRQLTEVQRDALHLLAVQAVSLLEGHRKAHELQSERTLQDELRQELQRRDSVIARASKMAALGELAGGIAHEINNPLAIIHGNVSRILLAEKAAALPADERMRVLEVVAATTMRVAKIVKALLTFSRNDDSTEKVATDLTQLVGEVLDLSRPRAMAAIVELKMVVPDYKVSVPCFPLPLAQVIMNLIGNAIDAVQCEFEKVVTVTLEDAPDVVRICIRDTGPGIPAAIREKIMTPFFTTKPVGQGTGLGLSIAKGIVERHQGRLFLDPEAAETTFVIELNKGQREPQAA